MLSAGLADDQRVERDLQFGMKGRPFRPGHAMRRPGAALGDEAGVVGRVPVPAVGDKGLGRQETVDELIDDRDDCVAFFDGESAAGAEIVLDIDNDEGVCFSDFFS